MKRFSGCFIALLVLFVVLCYGSLCGIIAFVSAGGDVLDWVATATMPATRFVTPLPTFTPYPTSTNTPIPTETPIFPDYFFATQTPEAIPFDIFSTSPDVMGPPFVPTVTTIETPTMTP